MTCIKTTFHYAVIMEKMLFKSYKIYLKNEVLRDKSHLSGYVQVKLKFFVTKMFSKRTTNNDLA